MITPAERSATKHSQITVKPEDLPLYCPTSSQSLWNMHPRVYIPLKESANGEAICPYCGALYRLETAAK